MSTEIQLPAQLQKAFQKFEDAKQQDTDGEERWSARELQTTLGYPKWQNFEKVIKKGMKACESINHDPDEHFTGVSKPLVTGNGAIIEVQDYLVSRRGAYLIAQNGDSRKPEIGLSQNYFAVATESLETLGEHLNDASRLVKRIDFREEHKDLSTSAVNCGVPTRNLGLFHDAGQSAFQGDRSVSEMKELKGIPADANYPDYMSEMELTANQLRMQITKHKLDTGDINTQKAAIETHAKVGKAVRDFVYDQTGLYPENMPILETTRQVVERCKEIEYLD